MKKPLIALFLFLSTFLVAPSASALTVSPARIEISGNPGQAVTGRFKVTNEQDAAVTLYSSAQNFEAQGDTGAPSFVDSNTGLSEWINVESSIRLAKGETKIVPFSISVPKDADPGGHFAAIFLSTVPPKGSGQVVVGAKIGVLILLRVAGKITEGGGPANLTPNGFLFSSLPVQFSYRFSNTGNDRVNPQGNLVIRDTIGLVSQTLSANKAGGNVLPGSVRRFDVMWGDTEDSSPNGFFASAGYEWSHFAFGWYGATLDLTYGTAGSAQLHTNLFLFPWQLFLIIGAVLVAAYYVLGALLRRYNRWIISQARGM